MSMSTASVQSGPTLLAGAAGSTLRALFDARFASGQRFKLGEAIGMFVPLCLDLKARHDRGERLYVHPSCIVAGPDGLPRLDAARAVVPTSPRDRTCTPPELQRTLEPGTAQATVFAIGAMLYEALTGELAGTGMARPRDIDPSLPPSLETLLAKALVSDATHRPGDLGALASALHAIAPQYSLAPPPADTSKLDHTGDFEVDISLSLIPSLPPGLQQPAKGSLAQPRTPVIVMPTGIPNGVNANGFAPPPQSRPAVPTPASSGAIIDPFAAVAAPQSAPSRPRVDPTEQLHVIKQQLESDPRPRYVVHKERMDHGPFAAVELLQQIASHKFLATDVLRDEISGESRVISEWSEFAPFADQSALKREIVAEKKAVAAVDKQDKRAGVMKTVIGAVLLLGILGGAGFFLYKKVGERKDDVEMADDNNVSVDVQGGVRGQKRAGGGPGGRGAGGGGGGGGGGGTSYEAAIASNVQEVAIGAKAGPDLNDGQLSAPMKNASFLGACGTPETTKVSVKVAIKNGRAVGVSVYPNPPDPRIASCIAGHVRGLSWTSNPKMDSFTTNY